MVAADNAGPHLAARVAAGPLATSARADIVAGATAGKLLFHVRGLDLGPVPSALIAQLVAPIDRSPTEFAASVPLRFERVPFRAAGLGILRTTNSQPATHPPHLVTLSRLRVVERTGLTSDQRAEIEVSRSRSAVTRRTTVGAMEDLLYTAIPVLDHGFVRVIDYMGDDGAIVQAARVSYGAGTKRTRDDAGLIGYLMRHRHTTPFEMCELKLHMKLPIFVARQLIRTRTASVNEYSARYSVLDREFYLPAPEHLGVQTTTNRQGRGHGVAPEQADRVLALLRDDAMRAYDHYEQLLSGHLGDADEGEGIARELARMDLSVNFYTQWYWKIDLHNLFHFLALRADPHAQYEIRVYALAILEVVKAWVPLAHAAFLEHRMGAVQLSARALATVKRLVSGDAVTRESSGLSPGEWRELMETLGREA